MDRISIDIMQRFKMIKDQIGHKRTILKADKQTLSPKDQECLKTTNINYYLLKKFVFVFRVNNPNAHNPNIEKRWNFKLGHYLNQYDTHHLILKIDPILKEAVEIKDDIYYFYQHNTYGNVTSRLEELIFTCRTSNVTYLQKF